MKEEFEPFDADNNDVDVEENLPLSKIKTRKRRKVKKERVASPDLKDFDSNADDTASFDNVTLNINDDNDVYDDDGGDFEEPAMREKTLEELMDEEEESRMLTEAEGYEAAEADTASASPHLPPPTSKRTAKKGRLADSEDSADKVMLKWPFDMDKVNIEPEDFNDYKKKSEP